jgi:MoxR-like ATPase
MATQNPIETEGTYPLPEAQVDRFMMKVLVDYPTDEEEFVIVERVTGPAVNVSPVATTEQLAALQAAGCDLAQGYLLGRPLTAQAFADHVRRGTAVRPATNRALI